MQENFNRSKKKVKRKRRKTKERNHFMKKYFIVIDERNQRLLRQEIHLNSYMMKSL